MDTLQTWAVVLAGGDGTRLRPLTRMITGEDRPKQFCEIYGGKTLLAQTRSRLAATVSPEQTVFAVVRAHERYYTEELVDVRPSRIVVQASNMGTTAAIVHSLQRVVSLAGNPVVGFFPTDHHYAGESRFVDSVRLAFQIAGADLETIILLGAHADYPEVEYGWIEQGDRVACPSTKSLHRVNRFWEKPSIQLAQRLRARGCLWNTFVMIGRASAFLDMLRASVPQMLRRPFLNDGGQDVVGAMAESAAADRAGEGIVAGDFSQQVLAASTARLAVLQLGDVGWSDLGTPERVRFAMARDALELRPAGSTQHENTEDLAKVAAF